MQLRAGAQTIGDMTPRLYRGLDKRLHPAAARSVLAHLIHLVRLHQVRSDGPPGFDSHFSAVLPGGVPVADDQNGPISP
jgi:hypothetical protein